MTIQEIKERVPLGMVLDDYSVELLGRGNRLRAKVNPIREGGDFDFFQDSQRFYDQGTSERGDVIDFIQITENLDKDAARSFLTEKYIGSTNPQSSYRPPPRPREPIKKNNDLLLSQLKSKAAGYLSDSRVHNGRSRERYRYFILEVDDIRKVAALDEPFIKLFEHSYLEVNKEKIRYIFDKFVGYDSYYNCPAIILYDLHGNVVNIIKYRPERNGTVLMQGSKPLKYLYTKSEEKPDSSYLYPFQFEMERMILKHGFAYVGEGLKNALNALVFGLPYISIESVSGANNKLLEYLQSPRMKDIFFIGAFDGDAAGEIAYKKISAVVPMENEFDFDSGMDFADKMKEDNK